MPKTPRRWGFAGVAANLFARRRWLRLDPVITDLDVAWQILDDYLLTYKEYQPQFWK